MTDSYVYAALLLSRAGKPITGESIVDVLRAGGIEADPERANRLAQALDGVDMVEVVKNAGIASVEAPSPPPEVKKEEPKPEQQEEDWGIGQGLTDLFK